MHPIAVWKLWKTIIINNRWMDKDESDLHIFQRTTRSRNMIRPNMVAPHRYVILHSTRITCSFHTSVLSVHWHLNAITPITLGQCKNEKAYIQWKHSIKMSGENKTRKGVEKYFLLVYLIFHQFTVHQFIAAAPVRTYNGSLSHCVI